MFGCGLAHTVATAPKATNFVVWLNITTPYMPITSDGKDPDLLPFLTPIADAIRKAIRKVRRPAASGASQKNVVLENLDEVIEIVSGGEKQYRFKRQLFYALRPIVMTETGQELKIGTSRASSPTTRPRTARFHSCTASRAAQSPTHIRARRSRSVP